MMSEAEDTLEMRRKLLASQSKDVFGETGMHPSAIWGVVMDVTYDDGTITVVSLVDGTANLYVSTGGGIIGAGEDEHIGGLSSTIASGGGMFFARYGKAVKEYPMPAINHVHFYFLSDAKILKTDEFLEDELAEDKAPLSPLFQTVHTLISTMQEEA
jgi:hypothetical protein